MATNKDLAQLAATLAQLAQALAEREPEQPSAPPVRAMPERVLLTVDEAAERLGIGRTLVFRFINSGELESVRIGRLRRVPVSAVAEYAARLAKKSAA